MLIIVRDPTTQQGEELIADQIEFSDCVVPRRYSNLLVAYCEYIHTQNEQEAPHFKTIPTQKDLHWLSVPICIALSVWEYNNEVRIVCLSENPVKVLRKVLEMTAFRKIYDMVGMYDCEGNIARVPKSYWKLLCSLGPRVLPDLQFSQYMASKEYQISPEIAPFMLPTAFARTRQKAILAADLIGYPIVMKPSFRWEGSGVHVLANQIELDEYLTTRKKIFGDRCFIIQKQTDAFENAFEFRTFWCPTSMEYLGMVGTNSYMRIDKYSEKSMVLNGMSEHTIHKVKVFSMRVMQALNQLWCRLSNSNQHFPIPLVRIDCFIQDKKVLLNEIEASSCLPSVFPMTTTGLEPRPDYERLFKVCKAFVHFF